MYVLLNCDNLKIVNICGFGNKIFVHKKFAQIQFNFLFGVIYIDRRSFSVHILKVLLNKKVFEQCIRPHVMHKNGPKVTEVYMEHFGIQCYPLM